MNENIRSIGAWFRVEKINKPKSKLSSGDSNWNRVSVPFSAPLTSCPMKSEHVQKMCRMLFSLLILHHGVTNEAISASNLLKHLNRIDDGYLAPIPILSSLNRLYQFAVSFVLDKFLPAKVLSYKKIRSLNSSEQVTQFYSTLSVGLQMYVSILFQIAPAKRMINPLSRTTSDNIPTQTSNSRWSIVKNVLGVIPEVPSVAATSKGLSSWYDVLDKVETSLLSSDFGVSPITESILFHFMNADSTTLYPIELRQVLDIRRDRAERRRIGYDLFKKMLDSCGNYAKSLLWLLNAAHHKCNASFTDPVHFMCNIESCGVRLEIHFLISLQA